MAILGASSRAAADRSVGFRGLLMVRSDVRTVGRAGRRFAGRRSVAAGGGGALKSRPRTVPEEEAYFRGKIRLPASSRALRRAAKVGNRRRSHGGDGFDWFLFAFGNSKIR